MVTLNTQNRQRIAEAVSAAERGTSGEIMVIMTEQSGDYRAVSLAVSIAVSTIAAWILWAFNIFNAFPALCAIQLFLLAACELLLQETGLIIKIMPASLLAKAASRNAKAHFVDHGLHTTRSRAAILLFVSARERYVELIPDIGIQQAAPPQAWQEIAQQFTLQARASSITQACVATIERCGALLAKYFPSQGDNPNELPDHVISRSDT